MFSWMYHLFQKYFLRDIVTALDKSSRTLNKFGRQIKRINDEQDDNQKLYLEQSQKIVVLEESLKCFESHLKHSNETLKTYETKFQEMRCLEENVESIFAEIGNVKKYVCKCQNQFIADLSKHETAFQNIIKNMEISDKSITLRSNNGNVVVCITNNTIVFGNWCFIMDNSTISISCQGKNVLKIDTEDPTLCLYKTVDSDYGMSTVTCAEFFLEHDKEKKLRINCENNDIPDATINLAH